MISWIKTNDFSNKNGYGLHELDDDNLIEACNEHANIIKNFLSKCWNESVRTKLSGCFIENLKQNDFENIVKVYFTKDYYIQKPLGVKSINKLIELAIAETENLDEAYDLFNKKIESSNVTSQTWKIGGIFSGLNSEGGFKKIREMISNEKEIPKV